MVELQGPGPAKAQIDDVCGIGIWAHAVDVSAGRPNNAVSNVGHPAPACAQHADRNDFGTMGCACNSSTVACDGSYDACNMCSVPRRWVGIAPVAVVQGILITSVAVLGY